jgi:hypothetical protein
VPDLTVGFSPGHAHVAANNGSTAFRNITVELLRPQGVMKRFYPTINAALSASPPDGAGIRQAGLLETNETGVVAAVIAPSSSWSPARDGRDRLVIMIDTIHDTSGPTEQNSSFPAGMLAWAPAGENWTVANKSGKENEAHGLGVQRLTPGKQSMALGSRLVSAKMAGVMARCYRSLPFLLARPHCISTATLRSKS